MKKWTGYRPELAQEKFDTIIIGSGMSGQIGRASCRERV